MWVWVWDNVGVSKVEMFLDGESWGLLERFWRTKYYRKRISLSEQRSYALKVVARDAMGNESEQGGVFLLR